MKKFVAGLLAGIILSLSLTTFAAVELNIIPNPYKVLIDGNESNVQGYNINGSTYLKLTDFVEAGLGVNFNKDKKQIEITTLSSPIQEQDTYPPTAVGLDSDGSILFDPDNDSVIADKYTTIEKINIYKVNDKKYVFFGDINVILKNTKTTLKVDNNKHIGTLIDWTGVSKEEIDPNKLRKITVNAVSLGKYKDLFFTYEDWINKIVPFFKEGK